MSAGALIEAWRAHLADNRRRSPHTVRAYVAAADRMLAAGAYADWGAIARIEAHALRAHLAARRAEGLGLVWAEGTRIGVAPPGRGVLDALLAELVADTLVAA